MKKSEAQEDFWKMARELNLQYVKMIDVLLATMTVKQIQKATGALK